MVGSCYVPRMDGLDHQNCEGGTAYKYSKDDEYRASILRFDMLSGERHGCYGWRERLVVAGRLQALRLALLVGLVDNTVPLAGANLHSRIGPRRGVVDTSQSRCAICPQKIWNLCSRRDGTHRGAFYFSCRRRPVGPAELMLGISEETSRTTRGRVEWYEGRPARRPRGKYHKL